MVNDPYENSATRTGLVNRMVAGRYEILETLGEGPLLTAYRARDKQANRIVTVKAVRPEFANDREMVQSLREGIGQAYSLAHSGIARIFDVGIDEDTGLLYLAEEYVRGIDLKERIRRAAPFQLAAATDTAIAIGEALEAAHSRGVAHGDIRPQNILIGPEGQTKLANFGIAEAQMRIARNDPTLLRRIVGYIAPDSAKAAAPTASADIYALGCILYEMLTGDVPYAGENAVQIALKHAQEPIPSPRQINGNVPPALDGIVRKALEKTPTARYTSVAELLIDLRAVRDALRFGKPLNWTPKERENSIDRSVPPAPVKPATVSTTASNDSSPSVMPTVPGGRTIREEERFDAPATPKTNGHSATATVATAGAVSPEEGILVRPARAKGVQWLTLINLFMALLLVGAIGGLYWVVMSNNRPDEAIILPKLVGMKLDDAEELAKDKHFSLAVVTREFRDKEAKDVIYQQGIPEARSIRPGKQVPVWVSNGPRMAIVPDLKERYYDSAVKVLQRDGLVVGRINREYDPVLSVGNVISQAPPPGENRPLGSAVDLVISKGAEPEPTPEPMPTFDPNTEPSPAPDPLSNDQTGTDNSTGTRTRYLRVTYPSTPYPAGEEPHRIRIDVMDDDGARTIKDTTIKPGEQVRIDRAKVVGETFTLKVYDNDELMIQQTQDDLPKNKKSKGGT